MPATTETITILTGMHRSGTSFLASVLHDAGAHMGDELLGPKKANIYGYYEDVAILQFHRSIFETQFDEEMLPPRPPVITADITKNAQRLAQERCGQFNWWGWKEPRTSLLLDLWAETLPHAHFLLVYRDPALVVDSLLRRGGINSIACRQATRMLNGWILYNTCILRFRRLHPERSMLFNLRDVLSNPEQFCHTAYERFGIEISPRTVRTRYDNTVMAMRPLRRRYPYPLTRLRSSRLYRKLEMTRDV